MSTINIIGLVVSIIVGTLIVFSCIKSFVKANLQDSQAERIRSKGIKTTAVIQEIKSGAGNEFYNRVTLQVLIKGESGEEFNAQIESAINITHLPRFQPGAIIDVAYDPEDPQKAAILTPTK